MPVWSLVLEVVVVVLEFLVVVLEAWSSCSRCGGRARLVVLEVVVGSTCRGRRVVVELVVVECRHVSPWWWCNPDGAWPQRGIETGRFTTSQVDRCERPVLFVRRSVGRSRVVHDGTGVSFSATVLQSLPVASACLIVA